MPLAFKLLETLSTEVSGVSLVMQTTDYLATPEKEEVFWRLTNHQFLFIRVLFSVNLLPGFLG